MAGLAQSASSARTAITSLPHDLFPRWCRMFMAGSLTCCRQPAAEAPQAGVWVEYEEVQQIKMGKAKVSLSCRRKILHALPEYAG